MDRKTRIKKIFQENLQRVRMERGWETKEVARRAGIATHHYRRYEVGERQPRLFMLVKLAGALEVELWVLFHGI